MATDLKLEDNMKIIFAVLAFATIGAAAEEWTFEVSDNAPRVVSCAVGRDWAARMETNALAAIGRARNRRTCVPA